MILQKDIPLKLIAFMLFLPFFSQKLEAQTVTEVTPTGSRATSLGLSYVTLTDFWSSLNNPANIAFNTSTYEAGIYFENSYLIKELNLTSVGFSNSNKYLNVGIYLSRYGISSYNQGDAALVFAKKLWQNISLGGKIVYHYIQVRDGYGSVGAFSADIGLTSEITPSFIAGFHIINPTQEKIGSEVKDPLPSGLVLGCTYITPWDLSISGDIEKQTSEDLSLHLGLEWIILNNFFARTGYQSAPNLICFGLGYKNSYLDFDFSITKHSTLGYSPQISTSIHLNRKKISSTKAVTE